MLCNQCHSGLTGNRSDTIRTDVRNFDADHMMTSRMMTSRALNVTMHATWSIPPESHSHLGCQAVVMGLSPKPHGGFFSFLGGELIQSSKVHIQKFITISSISEILVGFIITMATLLDFFKILFREDVLGPTGGLQARFH